MHVSEKFDSSINYWVEPQYCSIWNHVPGIPSTNKRWWTILLRRYSYQILFQRSRSVIDIVIPLRQRIEKERSGTFTFLQMVIELNILFIEFMETIPFPPFCWMKCQWNHIIWRIWIRMSPWWESRIRITKYWKQNMYQIESFRSVVWWWWKSVRDT